MEEQIHTKGIKEDKKKCGSSRQCEVKEEERRKRKSKCEGQMEWKKRVSNKIKAGGRNHVDEEGGGLGWVQGVADPPSSMSQIGTIC